MYDSYGLKILDENAMKPPENIDAIFKMWKS